MNRKAGLSYLELLIVLMLLAITAMLIGGAFDFARQAKTRATAFAVQQEPIILRSHLRRWVENMSPVPVENAFLGNAKGFSFTLNEGLRARPEATTITLQIYLDDTRSAMLKITGTKSSGEMTLQDLRTLEPNLTAAAFSYYGSKLGQPETWHTTWEESRLPRLIRFQATRGDGSPMPPLIIHPAVSYHQSLISALFPSPPT